MSEGHPRRLAALLVPALVAALAWLALYAPSLGYPFVWTDEDALGGGSLLRPPGEILAAFGEPLHRIDLGEGLGRQAYYRPLPVAALSLVAERAGRDPRSLRSFSIAIGALCVAAFGLFAGWLFERAGPALFAALFVALHPVAIEATVWIAGVPASLCALLVIATLAAALSSARAAKAASAAAWGGLSLLGLGLALLTKERAAVEPILLVAAFASLGSGPRPRASAGLVLAHLALVAGYVLLLRPAVLGSAFAGLPPIGDSFLTQVLTAVASWPGQLGWLLAPSHSSTSDAVRVVDSFADPLLWLGGALALGSLAAWWALRRARAPLAALGLAWVWIAFAPTSGVMPMLHASGERYLFLSTFGMALLLAGCAARWVDVRAPAWRRAGVAAVAALALAGLAQRTHARIPDWRSSRALFEADVKRDPAYREAYFMLAAKAHDAGSYEEAKRWLTPLLENDARFEGTASYLNWLSLGTLACNNLLALQDFAAIVVLYEGWSRSFVALARAPDIRLCAGQGYAGSDRPEEASRLYIGLAEEYGDTTSPRLQLMIARELAKQRRFDEARAWLRKAAPATANDRELRRQVRLLATQLGRVP